MTAKAKPQTMRLDEIAEAWRAYDEAMLQSGGEVTPESEAALATLNLLERDKADAYVVKIREIEARAARYKALADEASAKRKTAEAEVERLYQRVRDFMAERRVQVLAGDIWRFQWEGNGGKVPVELLRAPTDPDFPERFLKPLPPPPPREADLDRLRDEIRLCHAEALAVAKLVPGSHLQIR